jgi:hypothetical protein
MNCLDCRERIQSFLDGEASVGGELRDHLDACAECRREWAAAKMLQGGMSRLPRPQPSVTLASKLVAAVAEDQRVRRRRWIQGVAWISGVAAVLFAVLALPHLWRTNEVQVAERTNRLSTDPSQLAREAEDAQKAVASLAQSVKEQTKANWQMLLSAANPLESTETPGMPKLDDPLDPAAESLKQAGRNMVHSLEPMATSARGALAFLTRELPGFDMQSKEN